METRNPSSGLGPGSLSSSLAGEVEDDDKAAATKGADFVLHQGGDEEGAVDAGGGRGASQDRQERRGGAVPKRAGLLRYGKSCRLRWINCFRPSIKRGPIAPDEEDLILRPSIVSSHLLRRWRSSITAAPNADSLLKPTLDLGRAASFLVSRDQGFATDRRSDKPCKLISWRFDGVFYGKSCRLRWMNYFRPSIKRGPIAPDEEDLILHLHRLLGNRSKLSPNPSLFLSSFLP